MLGTTPMFIQYDEIKSQYKDLILFYRLGDFYEMFGEDAIKASKILDLALTARDGGKNVKVPMCGVPYHSAESYINRLIQAGEKIAICEQVEDPKTAKGIVKRDVVRVITAGTILEDTGLTQENNYIVAIYQYYKKYGLAIADISTGEFLTTEFKDLENLVTEIERYNPVECIYNIDQIDLKEKIIDCIGDESIQFSPHLSYIFELKNAREKLLEHFNVQSLESFGFTATEKASISVSGALLDYIYEMQKKKPLNILTIKYYTIDGCMNLDLATKINLELVKSLATTDKQDSLFDIVDQCQTAAGSRLLKNYLEKPLLDKNLICKRLEATQELSENHYVRLGLIEELKQVLDLERLASKIAFQTVNAKDLISLKLSLEHLPKIKAFLGNLTSPLFQSLAKDFDALEDIYQSIDDAIMDDPPFSLREGNFIKSNYHPLVAENRNLIHHSKESLETFLEEEREKTGIKNLKVGYNRVFGYFIEISKSNIDNAPAHYVRKQTLANCERYITDELKTLESRILNAGDTLKELEYQLFLNFVEALKEEVKRILETAHAVALMDLFQSFATVAIENHWVKPIVAKKKEDFLIKGLRHPVVEKRLIGESFISNDILFDDDGYLLIITGPNMSGKSTFCRSVALASILMQIGSFVPADEASMPIVDRVFARIGAHDRLSRGQSTFMVEMSEVANIVHNATKHSLVILDEVGRGTSTFDGLSIAWALIEYLHEETQCKTLFATHYHELTALSSRNGIKNYSVAVEEKNKKIIFLHKIMEGAASQSYGIHVARLAGIPEKILREAEKVLRKLEINQKESRQINLFESMNERIDQAMDEVAEAEKVNEELENFVKGISSLETEDYTIKDLARILLNLQEEANTLIKKE